MKLIILYLKAIPFLWLILSSTFCWSQSPHPKFVNFTSEDGLPSSEVHEAVQDNQGFMWFGTDNGLSRFDGYEFKNYGYKDGILDPVVLGLHVDQEGRLWVLTISGKIYISNDEGRFDPYEYNHLITQYSDKVYIANFFEFDQRNDDLYIALYGVGILKITKIGTHELIRTAYNSKIVIDSAGIYICSNSSWGKEGNVIDSKMESLDKDHAISTLILDNKRDTVYIPIINGVGGSNFIKLDSSLYFFINGLIGLTFESSEAMSFIKKPLPFSTSFKFGSKNYIGLHEKKGVYIYDNISNFPDNNSSAILDGATVTDFYEDNQSGLWILTVDQGIYYSQMNSIEVIDQSTGLSSDHIKAIDFKNDSLGFLALWDKTIVEYNFNSGKKSNEIAFEGKSSGYNYYVKYVPKKDKLYGGNFIQHYDKGSWKTFIHSKPYGRLGIKKIGSRPYKNSWVSVGYKNLVSFNYIKNELDFLLDPKGDNAKSYYAVNYDHDGRIWYGQNDGLWHYKNKIKHKVKNDHPIFNIRIEAIEYLSNDNIVLGSKGLGVGLWNRGDSILIIDTDDGLTSNMIENIYVDSLDNIWVGTLNGLNKVTINESQIEVKVLTVRHGLPGNEITQVKRKKDKIYVSTTKGLGIINDISKNEATVIPIFNSIKRNGQQVSIDSISNFGYGDNDFEFQYVGLDYKALGDIQYRYKIKGDNEWTATRNTLLSYPSITPGNYQLEIQAQNEDGFWSPSLTYKFSIAQPFWSRWWFIGLALLLFGLVVYHLYRNRISKLQKDQNIEKQIRALEKSALKAQMNPHFIFNVLNSINRTITQKNPEKASDLLTKFAKLIRSTLTNARSEKICLEDEIAYLDSYLYLECVRSNNSFSYKIHCDESIDQYEIEIPPMIIQPFVENAIKHGLKDIQNGVVSVDISMKDDILKVVVIDNGVGIDNLEHRKSNSFGMKITEERLKLLSNNEHTASNFTVEPTYTTSGGKNGTKATVSLKV